ncbi:hypothetical protein O181_055503 [Austropuccinia psidii MF-1]|uniref:Reverse transcriptase Ty1/copia-type domain-containing protein n=1 Tax=Austropuccinia psidii MF-1 TaxID=1389203 RepID=A0A9Q3EBB0_9BASI|nr:hypothetical protein [Austropuccinia psidii MF-1]
MEEELKKDEKLELIGGFRTQKGVENYRHDMGLQAKKRLPKQNHCAKEFTQTPGIDFEKTYARMGQLNTLRVLISHVCANELNLDQIFLNAPLEKTFYLLSHRARTLVAKNTVFS